jgi:hypothetical protein
LQVNELLLLIERGYLKLMKREKMSMDLLRLVNILLHRFRGKLSSMEAIDASLRTLLPVELLQRLPRVATTTRITLQPVELDEQLEVVELKVVVAPIELLRQKWIVVSVIDLQEDMVEVEELLPEVLQAAVQEGKMEEEEMQTCHIFWELVLDLLRMLRGGQSQQAIPRIVVVVVVHWVITVKMERIVWSLVLGGERGQRGTALGWQRMDSKGRFDLYMLLVDHCVDSGSLLLLLYTKMDSHCYVDDMMLCEIVYRAIAESDLLSLLVD